MAKRISEMENSELLEQLNSLRGIQNPSKEVSELIETIAEEVRLRKLALINDAFSKDADKKSDSVKSSKVKTIGTRLFRNRPEVDDKKEEEATDTVCGIKHNVTTTKATTSPIAECMENKNKKCESEAKAFKPAALKYLEPISGKYYKQVFDTFSVYYYVWGELDGKVYVERVFKSKEKNEIARTSNDKKAFLKLATPSTSEEYYQAKADVEIAIEEEDNRANELLSRIRVHTVSPFFFRNYAFSEMSKLFWPFLF